MPFSPRRALAACAVLALAASARADVTSGFFADVPIGARSMGMGGVGAAFADDAYAPLYNPAGIAQIDDLTFTAEYADLYELGLVKQTYFGALFQAAGFHHGVSYQNISVGFDPLPGALDEGQATYTFATDVGAFLLGGSVRYMGLSSTFALVEGSGFGFDAGVLWRPFERWTFGLSMKNVASRVSFGTGTDESIPQVWRLGAAYRHNLRLRAALDVVGERGEAVREMRFGGEYWLIHPAAAVVEIRRKDGTLFERRTGAADPGSLADLAFALRGGLRSQFTGAEKTAWTFGLSFGLANLMLDYAFESDNDAAGETNRFSLTYAFPSTAAPREAGRERTRVEERRPEAPPTRAAPAVPAAPVVAVIPFEDRTGDPNLAWLAPGIAEVVAAEVSSGRYAARALPRAQTAGVTTPAQARALGATHVVAGTFVRTGPGRIAVAARIYETTTGRLVDFAEAAGTEGEIFAIGREIADAVARAVAGR